MKMKGWRKVLFGAGALVFLAGGFGVCVLRPEGFVGFGAYATAVVSVCGIVVAGNFGEHAVGKEKAP